MPDINQVEDQNQDQDQPYQLSGDDLAELHGLASQLDSAGDARAGKLWDFIAAQSGGGDGSGGSSFTIQQSPQQPTSWLDDLENDLWGSGEAGDAQSAQPAETDDDEVDNPVDEDATAVVSNAASEFADPNGGGQANQSQQQQQAKPQQQQPAKQPNIADVALGQINSQEYLFGKSKRNYKAGVDKCNLGVADWIEQSGRPRPKVKYTSWRGLLGLTRDPSTHEWADPNVQISGWTAPMPVSKAQPGDVIAQAHGDHGGHVGVVVAPGQTVSVNSKTTPAGIVTNTPWGFRPRLPYGPDGLGQNGERRTDPDVIVRRYVGEKTPGSGKGLGGGGGTAW